jgi:hypothetical protein
MTSSRHGVMADLVRSKQHSHSVNHLRFQNGKFDTSRPKVRRRVCHRPLGLPKAIAPPPFFTVPPYFLGSIFGGVYARGGTEIRKAIKFALFKRKIFSCTTSDMKRTFSSAREKNEALKRMRFGSRRNAFRRPTRLPPRISSSFWTETLFNQLD